MKILILSIPTGGGHHQTARALEQCLKGYDGVECQVLDIAENVHSELAEAISKGYILSTSVAPKMYGSLYDYFDLRENPSSEASMTLKFLSQAFRKKLKEYLANYSPDIIISTHVFVTITVNRIAKHTKIGAKIISIVTDFTLHPTWEQAKSDYFVTASELLDYQATKKWGTTSKVMPIGIPISPKFSVKMPQKEARNELKIPDKFTVLVMMGSMGYGTHTIDALKKLDSLADDFQIYVVCGSNSRLKSKINGIKWNKSVYTVGFVNNIDVLMDAADCVITKPGGLSTSEALAKNLPMLMLNPIPGQEDRNKEFLLNNGVAMNISESFGVDEAIYQLIHCPWKLEQLRNNCNRLAKPEAAKTLCDFIYKNL